MICSCSFLFHSVPNVFSFPVFTRSFCELLLKELDHFEESDVPKGRPNTMNNYGVSLASVCTLNLECTHFRYMNAFHKGFCYVSNMYSVPACVYTYTCTYYLYPGLPILL